MHRSRFMARLLCAVMLFLAACDALPTDSSIVVKADEIAVVYAQDTGAIEKTLTEGQYEIHALQQGVTFYPLFWQVYSFRDDHTLSDIALGGEAIEVKTSDEAGVRVNLSLVFRVNADEIDLIFDTWGSDDYRARYIRPTAQRVVQNIIRLYTAAELSALPRFDLQTRIENALREELELNGFLLQRVDVTEIAFVE